MRVPPSDVALCHRRQRPADARPRYVALSAESLRLWRELEATSGRALLHTHGKLVIGRPDSAGLVNVLRYVDEFGLKHETFDAGDMRRRYPQHTVDNDEIAVLDRHGGYLRPELAVVAAVERAVAHGATIIAHSPVHAVEPDGDGVSVKSSTGRFRYRQVVVAAGPWASRLLPDHAAAIQIRRPLQAWFPPRTPTRFMPAEFPGFIRLGTDSFYGFPVIDGAAVKLGLSPSDNDVVVDPDALDRTVTIAQLERFRMLAQKYLPDLYPDPIRVGAYMEGYTMDNKALVGPVPSQPGVIALCGFSGHGFTFASVMGDIAADYVLDGSTPRDVTFLHPSRELETWSAAAGLAETKS